MVTLRKMISFGRLIHYITAMHIRPQQALEKLEKSSDVFIELFRHGSLSVELYKPDKEDKQTPHDRDEIYVIVSGTGTFLNGEESGEISPGDFLFVKAGVKHRFINFTADFSTWVFFYGPDGGEQTKNKDQ